MQLQCKINLYEEVKKDLVNERLQDYEINITGVMD